MKATMTLRRASRVTAMSVTVDFKIIDTGDGTFGLEVASSGADLTQDVSQSMLTLTCRRPTLTAIWSPPPLRATINARDDLSVTNDYAFTISQGISDDTLIGAFDGQLAVFR